MNATTLTVLVHILSQPARAASDDTPELIEDFDEITALSDDVDCAGDEFSAMISEDDGVVVDAPVDLQDGILFADVEGEPMVITIPGAEQAGPAIEVANGMVVYEGTALGANTVVQSLGDGARVLVEITGPEAPFEYPFELSVPLGGNIQLMDDGGLMVLDGSGELNAALHPPWATDAAGTSLPTWYEVEGDVVMLHVDHDGAVYPVVADPWWIPVMLVAYRCAGTPVCTASATWLYKQARSRW